MEDMKFHCGSKEEVCAEVKTSHTGLTHAEVLKRQKLYGKNVLKEEKPSLLQIFGRQFTSPLVFILFAASIVSLLLDEITDFFVVFGILLVNGTIGFWQDVRALVSLEALRKLTETKNMVIRNEKMELVPSAELVPGDWVVFHPGEVVTADIRLMESAGLMTDESLITGESTPVVKNHLHVLPETTLPYEWTNMLLTGSTICRGTGRGVVVKTGASTYFASIEEKVLEPTPETTLQVALRIFTRRFVFVVLGILAVLAVLGLFQGRSPVDLLYILLATLVSAVPEGLPLIITCVMVLGALHLRKKQALVRDLRSVETLGSTTVIASDKTGTITEGKLLVKETYGTDVAALKRIAALCNDSQDGIGDPLEVALADWVEEIGEIRASAPRKWEYPFDANLMLMATVNEVNGVEKLLVKGAYESLKEKAESQKGLKALDEAFHTLVHKGYRVLALAEGIGVSRDPSQWKLHIEGLIAFIDPPKKGVHHAVTAARKAGIHVIMITGDHPLTAQSIAHEVGICQKNDRVLTGQQIEKLGDSELSEELSHVTVLARILPEHKYRVVKALQAKHEIVAVTGDGVNDIPALRTANIGISMGEGAEAAKSVSEMILVDNNFTTIVDAIKNARIIAANIRKAIYYLVSTSFQELVLLIISIATSMPVPLSAIQILWINLITDGFMDKTFPFAKEEGNVMEMAPKKIEKAFFDSSQVKNILFFGLFQGLFCFFTYRFLASRVSFQLASTIVFNSVVFPQWANAIQAQKEKEPFLYNVRGSFSINPYIFGVLPFAVLLQCAVIYIVPGIFNVVPLSWTDWSFPIASFIFAFAMVEIRKWLTWFMNRRVVKS